MRETSADWLEHKKGRNWFSSQFKSRSGAGFRVMTLPPTRTIGRDTEVHSGKHLINGCGCYSLVELGNGVVETSDSVAPQLLSLHLA